jgi:hypothetical protein
VRRIIYLVVFAFCLFIAMISGVGWVASLKNPLEINLHMSGILRVLSPLELRIVDGSFFIGISRWGVGYIPFAYPIVYGLIWPVSSLLLRYICRNRKPQRGFSIDNKMNGNEGDM